MHPVLNQSHFLIKEHVGMLKAANQYDVFNPNNQQKILECREPNLGWLTKIFRFTDYKRMTPFAIEIRTPEGMPVFSVRRGLSLWLSKVEVLDPNGVLVGLFQQKWFSIGGKFTVLDAQGNAVCDLVGKWTSWQFSFKQGTQVLATVSKKWSGLGKELFTSADNYVLSISEQVPANDPNRILILAAVMCIDMVLKED